MSDARAKTVAAVALGASIVLGTAGQLLLKLAALRTVNAPMTVGTMAWLATALFVYSLGIVNWIVALRQVRLSIAYPVSSLNYVGIMAGSYWWFGEQLGPARMLGVAMIVGGVMLVVLGRETGK